MLQAIFKLIFIVLLARMAQGLFRAFRNKPRPKVTPKSEPKQTEDPDYGNLTPYEIEDAEFEDLPDDRK